MKQKRHFVNVILKFIRRVFISDYRLACFMLPDSVCQHTIVDVSNSKKFYVLTAVINVRVDLSVYATCNMHCTCMHVCACEMKRRCKRMYELLEVRTYGETDPRDAQLKKKGIVI